jgi:predicted NUDIX family NTP pyrophosphohydrolase
MALVSAGILLFRRGGELEFFLAHPGGPYFARKDDGAWTIPKGAPLPEETLLEAAIREFREEIGFTPSGDFIELGSVRQKGGKIVHAFGVESTTPPGFVLQSNDFELEWPPKSGALRSYPEVDQAEFFGLERARAKMIPAQTPFLDRLAAHCGE